MFGRASGLAPGVAFVPTLRAVIDGPDITLDRAVVLVGRHPQCDTRLESNWVSRRHCILTVEGGEVVVCDLGSTNGTRINGQRVERGRLRPGDEISIGHTRYRLEAAPAYHSTVARFPSGPEPRCGHQTASEGSDPV
jgi:predicted component of type VI protein secretion system